MVRGNPEFRYEAGLIPLNPVGKNGRPIWHAKQPTFLDPLLDYWKSKWLCEADDRCAELSSRLQAAFDEHYAAQCGFCTSGFIMAATALIERTPKASREDILTALSGHVCRCTGYIKIVSAVEAAAKGDVHPERVEPSFEPEEAEVLIPGSPA